MDSRTTIDPGAQETSVQPEKENSSAAHSQQVQGDKSYAAAVIAVIFFIVPIAGFAVMYFGSESAMVVGPLAGFLLLVAGVSYLLLSWMLVESDEAPDWAKRTPRARSEKEAGKAPGHAAGFHQLPSEGHPA